MKTPKRRNIEKLLENIIRKEVREELLSVTSVTEAKDYDLDAPYAIFVPYIEQINWQNSSGESSSTGINISPKDGTLQMLRSIIYKRSYDTFGTDNDGEDIHNGVQKILKQNLPLVKEIIKLVETVKVQQKKDSKRLTMLVNKFEKSALTQLKNPKTKPRSR